jgi:hypothetical protein
MYDKKTLHKGGNVTKDDEAFLTSNTNPWETSASGHGYNAKFSDDTGFEAGAIHGDSDTHGLVNRLPDEATAAIDNVYRVIDDQVDLPADKMLTGGGPVSQNLRAKDRDNYRAYKDGTGPQGNMRKPR